MRNRYDKESVTGICSCNLFYRSCKASGKQCGGTGRFVLIAIYYCLGFEEIIGGVNEKVLTSAYKTMIEDGKNIWPVLESGVFLEVSNGVEEITIYRSAKSDTRDSKLVTVYFSKLTDMYAEHTNMDEFYVHMPNAANNISQEQLEHGWDVEYLGYYEFAESYVSAKGYKVNVLEDTAEEPSEDYVSEKSAVFVADGVQYTIKGRTSMENIKRIVDSLE